MGFIEYLIVSSSILLLAEGLNCKYPYHDGEYENAGTICQWEQDSFYYDKQEDEWILLPKNSDDNCFELRARKKYWERRIE